MEGGFFVESVPSGAEFLGLIGCWKCGQLPPPNAPACESGHVTCFECYDPVVNKCQLVFQEVGANGRRRLTGKVACLKGMTSGACHPWTLAYNVIVGYSPGELWNDDDDGVVSGGKVERNGLSAKGNDNKVPCVFHGCVFETLTMENFVAHWRDDHGIPVVGTGEAGLQRFWLNQKLFSGGVGMPYIPFIVKRECSHYIFVCTKEKQGSGEYYVMSIYSILSGAEAGGVAFGNVGFVSTGGSATDTGAGQWTGEIPSLRNYFRFGSSRNSRDPCMVFPISSGVGAVRGLEVELDDLDEDVVVKLLEERSSRNNSADSKDDDDDDDLENLAEYV